jgi:hypothetical protein
MDKQTKYGGQTKEMDLIDKDTEECKIAFLGN